MRLLAEDLAGGMSLQMQVSKLSTELENAKLKLLSVQRNYDNLSSAHQRALADLDDLRERLEHAEARQGGETPEAIGARDEDDGSSARAAEVAEAAAAALEAKLATAQEARAAAE